MRGVERYRLDTLTATQARLDAGTDIEQLGPGLQGHYPQMPEDAAVDVVTSAVDPLDAA
ncbi:hypothetical protein ACFXKJ_37990 [Kitasatospora indigofera]|uniref:hypothetical protein n=1 Tax=Kitasatospora indigofera TaxID=67307 RepID=UPI00367BF744